MQQAAIGCLGIFCALLAYFLTIGLVLDEIVPRAHLENLDPTGGAGVILAIGPPIWIVLLTAALLALFGRRFVWIVGSGIVVALGSLFVAWLLLLG